MKTTKSIITCEALIYAGQDDEIADLFEIASDIIETRDAVNIQGVKRWLPSYTRYSELDAALNPDLLNRVIIHALEHR